MSDYERTDRGKQRLQKALRLGVLVGLLALVTGIGVLHQYGGVKPVGVDALCPFGGIETLGTLITSASLVSKIAVSSVVLLGATVLLALLFQRAFCGYLCPLGGMQDMFGWLGKVVFKGRKRPQVPAAVDRWARYLKYGVLAFAAIGTWLAAEGLLAGFGFEPGSALVIRPYDPWVAWMHLSSAEVFAEFSIGLVILGVSLVGSLVYERFFCKYLCPMGAFLGLAGKLSFFKVRRNAETCIDCTACDKACPVNIKVSEADVVTSAECISCNECVNSCPVKDTLVVAPKTGTAMKTGTVFASVLGIMAAVVVGATLLGGFEWTLVTPQAAAAEAAAQGVTFDVAEIKGSWTFVDAATATGVPAQAIKAKFGITDAEMASQIKDVAPAKGFDVHTDVREWFAAEMEKIAAEAAKGGGASSESSGD